MKFFASARAFARLEPSRRGRRLQLEALEDRCLPAGAALTNGLAQLPLSFEPNRGQAVAGADFVARGPDYTLALNGGGATLALQSGEVLNMTLLGADASVRGMGLDPQTGQAQYGRVAYNGAAPGIDVVYYSTAGQPEYDLVLHPGTNPSTVRLQFQGQQGLSLDSTGNLVVQMANDRIVEQAPVLYQEAGGVRRPVSGHYVLEGGGQVGLAVGDYDPGADLTVDPVLGYSTYLGGSGKDQGNGIAVDGAGNMYIVGTTTSSDFPTNNPQQGSLGGTQDAFVTKLNADGTLAWSTYLGGSGVDSGNGIAVDGTGNVYVSGTSPSSYITGGNFPAGSQSAFVARLSSAGNLLWTTYLGGGTQGAGAGVAVDSAGNVYTTGTTAAVNINPTNNAFQSNYGGGGTDAFVARLNSAGAIVYSTYLGGSGNDSGAGIAVDSAGDMYVTGTTTSSNFPTSNPFQATLGGTQDAFVTKLNADGTLAWSTYLGGTAGYPYSSTSGTDGGQGIAVDGSGNAYVTGYTNSTDFPTRNAFQASTEASFGYSLPDAFVARFNADGTLAYSTYLGGYSPDQGNAIAVDPAGNAHVTGYTLSSDFPVKDSWAPTPIQVNNASYYTNDAFVAGLNADGTLAYSTYLGGYAADQGNGIAVGPGGNIYLTGATASGNFPMMHPRVQGALPGMQAAFVTRLQPGTWRVLDVATGSDNNARLLWQDGAGHVTVRTATNSFQIKSSQIFGPYTGWTGRAVAAGSNGLTWVLWDGPSGAAALWLLDNGGNFLDASGLGAYAGWTAIDVAVGSDNQARVLWVNSAGLTIVWTVDNNFHVTPGPYYGPYAGWTPRSLDAGADGQLRLLWNNTSGAAALWLLDGTGTFVSGQGFAAATNWVAMDVTVGSDNKTRILWYNTLTGLAVVWTVDSAFNVQAGPLFTAGAGWTAEALAGGADGKLRLVWANADGTMSEWLLGLDDALQTSGNYGPF